MRYIRKFSLSLAAMSAPAFELIIWALRLSCVLLICSMMILAIVENDPRRYDAYCCAVAMLELPQSILLLAALGAAIVEERFRS